MFVCHQAKHSRSNQTEIYPYVFHLHLEEKRLYKISADCPKPKKLSGEISLSMERSTICTTLAATFEPLASHDFATALLLISAQHTAHAAQQGFGHAWGAVLGTWQRSFSISV